MKKIYLTRHGETQWNAEFKIQGHCDSPLTKNGILQAEKQAEYFNEKKIRIDAAYSSSSTRAYNTAQIILKKYDLDIVRLNDLMEINLKCWEGRNRFEVQKCDPIQSDNFWNNPHIYKPQEGETFFEVQKRAVTTINNILKTSENKSNIFIASHAAFIKTVLAFVEKRDIKDLWKPPKMHNCGCFVIQGNYLESSDIVDSFYPDLEISTTL